MRKSIIAILVGVLTLVVAVPASAHSLRDHCVEAGLPAFICDQVPDRDHAPPE